MQRGVGRGLAATKPAWMTGGSVSSSLGGLQGRQSRRSSSRDDGHSGSRRRSKSRSRSKGRRHLGSGGDGSRRERSRRGSDSRGRRSKSRSRSRSRHRSGERRNRAGRDDAAKNGGGSTAGEVAARALEQAFGGGAAVGRGRGRGSTIPAWMTHPGGVGGLQDHGSKGDRGGGRRSAAEKSPPRFTRNSSPLPPEPTMSNGGMAGGRGWSRSGGGHYGSGGGGGGGRGGSGGRGNGRAPEKLPAVFSVHKGEVVKTETFGAFVKLENYRKHGLVHCSQMASYRVEDVTDICKAGDTVFVKVIEVTDGADPREQRIALSMKLVNQADGTDLDPSNAEAETDLQRRKPAGGADRAPVQLEAVFNTTCTKCGVHGHLSIDCFSRGGKKYELVDEEEPSSAMTNGGGGASGGGMRGVRREAPRGGDVLAGGRGRGATMPAWMTNLGLVDKLNKKSHRKEKKSKKKKSDRRGHRDRGDDDSSGSDSDSDDDGDGEKKHKKHKKHSRKHRSSKHKKHHKRSSHKHSSSRKKDGKKDRGDSDSDSGSDDNNASGGDGRGRVSMNGAGGRDRSRSRSRSRGHRNGNGYGKHDNGVSRRRSGSGDGRGAGGRRGRSGSRIRGGGGGVRGGGFRAGDRGRVGDVSPAAAAGVGDGDRWKPRGDSERSDSRGSR